MSSNQTVGGTGASGDSIGSGDPHDFSHQGAPTQSQLHDLALKQLYRQPDIGPETVLVNGRKAGEFAMIAWSQRVLNERARQREKRRRNGSSTKLVSTSDPSKSKSVSSHVASPPISSPTIAKPINKLAAMIKSIRSNTATGRPKTSIQPLPAQAGKSKL